jgi:hypothetical protein
MMQHHDVPLVQGLLAGARVPCCCSRYPFVLHKQSTVLPAGCTVFTEGACAVRHGSRPLHMLC